VCVNEKERERESVCVCLHVHECVRNLPAKPLVAIVVDKPVVL